MSAGIWIGLAIGIAVLVLALWKPVLARMGIGYAFERKRQTALVVAGLMIATTVIAAAGITADSSGASFAESLTSQIYVTDAHVESFWDPPARADMESIATDTPFSDDVVAYASALRREMPFESAETGRGDTETTILGVDPSSYAQVARWVAVEGTAPGSLQAWPRSQVVVNEAAARDFGLAVGDEVNLFMGDETRIVWNRTVYDGNWVLTADSGLGPGFDHPDNVDTFRHPMQAMAYHFPNGQFEMLPLTFMADAPADTEIQLTVTDPGQNVYQSDSANGHVEVVVDDPPNYAPSNWTLEVRSPFAQDVAFNVTVVQPVEQLLDDRVFSYTVGAIIEQQGSDPVRNAAAVFVHRGELGAITGQEDRADLLLMDMADDTDLRALRTQLQKETDDRIGGGWASVPRLELTEAKRQIELATQAVFLGIGSFSIITGFMLIGVLMALLVEERKRILATARALGAQRGHLTLAATHEGSLYAILASFAGLLGATALAAAVMRAASRALESENAQGVLVVKIGTVLSSIGFGFSLTLLVIALAAYRTTRLHIAAALKDEEVEPKQGKVFRLLVQIVLIFTGLVLLLTASIDPNAVALSLGPCFVMLGIGPLVARGRHRNLAMATMGGILSAYLIASFWFIDVSSDTDFFSFPLRAVLLAITLGLVAAYSTILHRGVNAVGRLSKRGGPLIEAAVANMGRKPGRSAMTIAMFAMVLVILTTLGTMFATFEPNDLGDAGGYDVVADTNFPIGDPVAYLQENPPSSGIDPFDGIGSWVATPWSDSGLWSIRDAQTDENLWSPFGSRLSDSLVGVTPEFAESARFGAIKASGMSAREAMQRVATDPSAVIVSEQVQMDTESGGSRPIRLGQELKFGSGEDAPRFQVVGVASGVGAAGLFMNAQVLEDWSQDRYDQPAGVRIWIDAPGRDHGDVAFAFESAFRRASMEATDVDNIDSADAAASQAFQFVISLFLGLGIIIGMVALALIMGRNVLLRRAEIGTLRAIGAKPWQILLMFSFEALYLTLFAIGIGFGVGLLLAWRMIQLDDIWVPLRVDWGGLATLYGITLLAALGTAFVPAFRASRTPPAQAVRYVE